MTMGQCSTDQTPVQTANAVGESGHMTVMSDELIIQEKGNGYRRPWLLAHMYGPSSFKCTSRPTHNYAMGITDDYR